MNTIWRVSSYLFQHRLLFALTLIFAVSMVGLEMAVPWTVRSLLGKVEAEASFDQLWAGIITIGLLYLGSAGFNGLRIVVNNTLEQRVLLAMRRDIHQKLLHLPISFFDQRKSGDISSRVIEDVANVERALLDGTEMGSRAIFTIVGVTVFLFILNPLLATLVFLPVPLLIVGGYFYAKGSRRIWKRVREAGGDLNSLLVEDIQGNRLIQTFGLQTREGGRFEELAERWNPLLDPVAQQNLVEDINSLARDFLRRMKVSFRLVPPTKERVEEWADRLCQNEAFHQIRRHQDLKEYLKLYMLIVLGK
ncbi:MAG: ABC transporter transmembrane domain-containing protein [Spirochaetota bacterium]